MKRKLRSRRGETLTETLVAVLIVALSTVILAAMTATAARLDRSAGEITDRFYEELTAAEACTGASASGTVVLEGDLELAHGPASVYVDFYGTEGGLISYRAAGGGAP